MLNLINKDIDTSSASFYYYLHPDTEEDEILTEAILGTEIETHPERCIPAFTLSDILMLLPPYLHVKDDIYKWCLIPFLDKFTMTYVADNPLVIFDNCDEIIDVAFELLLWCQDNHYLD